MPKLGMEPIRRASLVAAAIDEIGESGSLDVTVSRIAGRAGVSSALAHHYFGTKDEIFFSAMRHILSVYGGEVSDGLKGANSPKERLDAVIRAGFTQSSFRPEVINAWLNFYVKARNSAEIARLLTIYQSRLRSNLKDALRSLMDGDLDEAAEGIAAMIDGVFLRQGLQQTPPKPENGAALVIDYADRLLASKS